MLCSVKNHSRHSRCWDEESRLPPPQINNKIISLEACNCKPMSLCLFSLKGYLNIIHVQAKINTVSPDEPPKQREPLWLRSRQKSKGQYLIMILDNDNSPHHMRNADTSYDWTQCACSLMAEKMHSSEMLKWLNKFLCKKQARFRMAVASLFVFGTKKKRVNPTAIMLSRWRMVCAPLNSWILVFAGIYSMATYLWTIIFFSSGIQCCLYPFLGKLYYPASNWTQIASPWFKKGFSVSVPRWRKMWKGMQQSWIYNWNLCVL